MDPPTLTLRTLPLDTIDLSGARHRFRAATDEEVAALAQDMALKGLLNPIKACPHPKDPERHLLVAGERRCLAGILLRWTEIQTLYYNRTLTQEEHITASVMDNTASRETNRLARAVIVYELMRRLNISARAACSMVMFSQTEFSRLKGFLDALPEVQEFILRSELPVSVILACLKAPSDKALAILTEASQKSLTAREVAKAVSAMKPPRQKSLKIAGIGEIKLAPGQDLKSLLKALEAKK